MRLFVLSALAATAAAQSFPLDCTLLLSVTGHEADIEKFFAEVNALAGVAVHSNSTYCKDEECQLVDDPNTTPRAPPAPPGGYEYAHLPYSTHAVDTPIGKGPAEVIAAAETATAQRAAPEARPAAAAASQGVRAAEAPASSGVSALVAGAAAVVAVAAVAMGFGVRRSLKSPSKKAAKPAGLRLP